MLDMVRSLDKVASLPEQTEVYCAHEYTLENLRFAIAVDPHNTALLARYRTEQAKRERGMPTLPSTIALEKATNPFLRVFEPRHCGSDSHPHRSCGQFLKRKF
jgi:hydroxyacylglutathione hydrolase